MSGYRYQRSSSTNSKWGSNSKNNTNNANPQQKRIYLKASTNTKRTNSTNTKTRGGWGSSSTKKEKEEEPKPKSFTNIYNSGLKWAPKKKTVYTKKTQTKTTNTKKVTGTKPSKIKSFIPTTKNKTKFKPKPRSKPIFKSKPKSKPKPKPIPKSKPKPKPKPIQKKTQTRKTTFISKKPSFGKQTNQKAARKIPEETINNGYKWGSKKSQVVCRIENSQKKRDSTLYTIKYQNKTVERLFKHFVWFRSKLKERYGSIVIPPLVERSKKKLDNDNFTKKMVDLQIFMNRILSHPVLRNSILLTKFLETQFPEQWKILKQWINTENKMCAPFWQSVRFNLSNDETRENAEPENFKALSLTLKKKIKTINSASESLDLRYADNAEIQATLGSVVRELGFNKGYGIGWKESCYPSKKLGESVIGLGNTFETISKETFNVTQLDNFLITSMFEDHNKMIKDVNSLIKNRESTQEEYKRMITILNRQSRSSMSQESSNMENKRVKVENIKQRGVALSKISLAEMDKFHSLQESEIKDQFSDLCQRKIDYHENAINIWQSLLSQINQIPVKYGSQK
ncbi:sorting nexin [Anaeramoeba flamelloides]|uniref:Sorting nexin n=1 Tax=Anaeramoeba flamelloides TaxID=1746091 RepID=A0AAV7Y4X9_9EUKA|nr:sorting nexin [Anaeramoeba flamelloides]